jgi:hypothetical protein
MVILMIINPNPHCLFAITKAAAMEFKKPLLPHHLLSPVGGGGRGVLDQQTYNFA